MSTESPLPKTHLREPDPVHAADRAWSRYLTQPEAAFQLASEAIDAQASQPQAGSGWLYLARALARCRMMGSRPDQSAIRADFAAARTAFERDADARGLRLARLEDAATAMRMADWRRALVELEALIGVFDLNTLDPDNFYLYFGLSTASVYQGHLEEGLRFGYAGLHLAQQLEMGAEMTAIVMPLGVALMAAKDPEEACLLIDAAIAQAERAESPGLTKVHRNNRAVALRRMGRLDEALADLVDVLASDAPMVGGQHFVHFNAAELFIKRNEIADAERHLEIARDLLRRQGAAGLDLIKLYYIEGAIARQRGQLQAAADAFQVVDRMLPDVSALRFNDRAEFYDEYADVLARAARPGNAFEAQRKSSRFYRDNLAVVNRMRRFAMQVRLEIDRVNAELARESSERRALQSINLQLREQVEQAMQEAERARDEASHDGLTGVFSRRYLDAALPQLLRLSQQSATPLALVMIDLDFFKEVNDNHGHAAGDCVLVEFCVLARQNLRGSDMIGRYGGEEFCMVLIGCGPDAARQRIAALLEAVRKSTFACGKQHVSGVTFSAGISVYPEDGTQIQQLIAHADQRLIRAKRAGRARIVTGSDTTRTTDGL
ncbi:MAG TPA: diguanylate cyclase [Usitatibacteraceae bacterium]|nr:diguanylate cyclase [Usitatibacteraceae bacterium]